MTAALTLAEFKARTVMPTADVNELEAQTPGFWATQIVAAQAWIDARLKKRYAVPFAAPAPEIYLGWITTLVTYTGYQRRGWNPSSAENQLIVDAVKAAKEEIKEASDSNEGLFELPLRQSDPTTSGVVSGGPLGYAEQSPWDWTDRQVEAVRGF